MKNYTGLKNNKLTAISFVRMDKKASIWLFKCDCGKEKELRANKVFSKTTTTKACGCLIPNRNFDLSKSLYRLTKKSAIDRNYEFKLSYDFFSKEIFKNCFYCENLPTKKFFSQNKINFILCNGLDRKDNNIGYLEYNCVPCCTICNYAKRDLDFDYFLEWINRLKINK